jgi:hypothetical protein
LYFSLGDKAATGHSIMFSVGYLFVCFIIIAMWRHTS